MSPVKASNLSRKQVMLLKMSRVLGEYNSCFVHRLQCERLLKDADQIIRLINHSAHVFHSQ